MQVRLVTFGKKGNRKEFPVQNGPVVIGRKVDADLRIPLNEISRDHCVVSLTNGKLVVRDLKSSNGTFVNSQKIQEATLKAGDRMSVGPVEFVVQIDGIPKTIVPPSKPAAPAAAPAKGAVAAGKPPPVPAKKPAAQDEDDFDIDLGSGALNVDDLSDLDIDAMGDTDESDEPLEMDELEEIDEDDVLEDDK